MKMTSSEPVSQTSGLQSNGFGLTNTSKIIDIVINNTSASASIEWNEEAWRHSFEVDLMSSVTMSDAALPFLEASEGAAFLQVATVTAFEHHDMSVCPSYGAIKAATVNHAAQLAAI